MEIENDQMILSEWQRHTAAIISESCFLAYAQWARACRTDQRNALEIEQTTADRPR